ncbi:hypothetical protein [Spirosoma endophyticum]|uniref:Uncharacterized protein n=1 Tax=Spirosoma endophyticum TaxID=662367 RepID=A0A1I2EAK7_9BACT|nr:hypothetical protein [Spirosoma endophyticum]SFE90034.1 hypothetical protein SAMN05216167_12195 [Spirosoma endophyticum]
MARSNPLFTELLEQYIFSVANTLIEHVPKETQDGLIAPLKQIEPVSLPPGLLLPDKSDLDKPSPNNLN